MDALEQQIDELFDCPADVRLAAVVDRVGPRLDRAAGNVYLYGAGQLGKSTLALIRRCGITPAGFLDSNPEKHGTAVDGLPVFSLGHIIDAKVSSLLAVVTVYNCRPVLDSLKKAGIPAATFAELAWTVGGPLLPYLSVEQPQELWLHRDAIRRAGALWADHKSREEYLAQIRWSLTLDPFTLPHHDDPGDTYFDSGIVHLGDNEVFIDCGAYDGDSLAAFMARCPTYLEAVGLEPDPLNRDACLRRFGGVEVMNRARVRLLPYAASDSRGVLTFQSLGTVASAVDTNGTEVSAAPLDELVSAPPPTFIKMDIEGAEPMALRGAARIMQDHAPTIAACLYHERQHLWEIPLQIAESQPRYKLFLRRYADECWETVCYASR